MKLTTLTASILLVSATNALASGTHEGGHGHTISDGHKHKDGHIEQGVDKQRYIGQTAREAVVEQHKEQDDHQAYGSGANAGCN